MLKIIRKTLTGVFVVLLLLAAVAGVYLFWYGHRPLPEAIADKPLFQGVIYSRLIRTEPRPLVIHVVKIDLDAPGIGFLVTPHDNLDGYVYSARTISQFLDDFDAQIAINGDFFDPWWEYGPTNYYPHDGDGVNVRGLTVSQGNVVTEGYSPVYDALYISKDNRVSFTRPEGDLYNVIAGNLMIVRDGAYDSTIKPDPYIEQAHPRTAVALSRDEHTLIIVVVDGRQPNYSEGVTLPELASIIVESGGYTALNFDGGGSSALVMEGADGKPLQLGSAIHTRIPGRERPIANHLGIFALPLTR
jgi:phosphodiester glycosidase